MAPGLLAWKLGRAQRVPVFGRIGPPRRHVCHDRWPVRNYGPGHDPRRTGGRCPATAGSPSGCGREPVPGACALTRYRCSRPSVLKSKLIRLDTGRLKPHLRRHRDMAARAPPRCRAPRHPLMPAPPARHRPLVCPPATSRAAHARPGQPSSHCITARPAAPVADEAAASGPLIIRFQAHTAGRGPRNPADHADPAHRTS